MLYDVFVSYVSEDRAVVERLVAALQANGLRVWFDKRSLLVGDNWMSLVMRAIESSHHFMPCFSDNYARKDRSVMQDELCAAVAEGRKRKPESAWFLPVRLDAGASVPDPAIGIDFRSIHHLNLYGASWDDGIGQLVQRARSSTRGVAAPRYMVGDVSVEVYMDLLGGGQSYSWREVQFAYDHAFTPLPPELEATRARVVEQETLLAKAKDREFFNGPCIRLQQARLNIGASDPSAERKEPQFLLRPTCWHDYAVANKHIDAHMAESASPHQTAREMFADESRLVTSRRVDWIPLSNILTCSVVLLTSDMHTLIGLRTDRVDNHAGVWASSFAENINRAKDEPSDPSDFWSTPRWELDTEAKADFDYRPAACPNPFSAVRRGVYEEVSMDLAGEVTRDDITLLHLAWDLTSFNPHLYFLLRTKRGIEDVKAMTRGSRAPDAWEHTLFPVEFTLEGELRNRLLFSQWAHISKGAVLRALVEVHGFPATASALRNRP
jgi:hypothetical protein